MATKKYINLDNLSTFLSSLRETFSVLGHKHTISDISDYTVDSELSLTSANPVQNKVVNAEFDAISEAFEALESAIDDKADVTHEHSAIDITSGVLSMSHGGTEATDGATGLKNLFAAGNTILSSYQYGSELPSTASTGQVFFEEATGTIADIGQDVATALRAVNLLDNSDFTNPVNQRGLSSYSGSGYTIDRWRKQGSSMNLRIDSGYVYLNNPDASIRYYFQQPTGIKAEVGKVYTMACYDRTAGKIQAFPVAVPEVGSSADAGNISNGTLRLSNDANNGIVWTLMVNQNSIARMNWAALYEGEYTAETLPPYVPKGYGAELAECQRYYENSWFNSEKTVRTQNYANCYSNLNADGVIYYKKHKRIAPTVTFYPTGSNTAWQIYNDSKYQDVGSVSSLNRNGIDALTFRIGKSSDDATVWETGKTVQVNGHWEASADL